MKKDVLRYIIVDNLFARYTVVLSMDTKTTSVWCEECETWVAEWEGDQLSRHSATELLEEIVSAHEDDFPEKVEFSTERFI